MINNFNSVRRDLQSRYSHACAAEQIDEILDGVIAEHSASARVTDFLPVLVARDAAERIEAHIQAVGRPAQRRKRIVFASRGNVSRAKLAVAIARRLSDEGVLAFAAHSHPENDSDPRFLQLRDERGLDPVAPTPQAGSPRTLNAPDVVVYLDRVGEADLPGLRQVQWDVPASEDMGMDELRDLADDLELRIIALLDTLGVSVDGRTQTLLPA